jgi:hypothetical protein
MYAYDRTLLGKLGFAAPDRRDRHQRGRMATR